MTASDTITRKPTVTERASDTTPILIVTGEGAIAIRAGTSVTPDDQSITSIIFPEATQVRIFADLQPGRDYGVALDDAGFPFAAQIETNRPLDEGFFAGFHYAPGGNAEGRSGGDAVAAINPFSLWDTGFRPACADMRGMALIEDKGIRVWVDIYLLGLEYRQIGTSHFGTEIADGKSLDVLDYPKAIEIYASEGKRLLTYDEFRAATFGVTERSSAPRDPVKTGLDSARTSRFGLMQATGNMWVWGTDGDPDDPRPSLFGGSWLSGSDAGSRCASLACWPGDSDGLVSARGACDHL